MKHHPRKRFGQNFLRDQGVIRRIITSIAPAPGDALVEIGPGQGAITTGLLRASGTLDVVELDRDLVRPLAQRCAGDGELRIHSADALTFDFCSLTPAGGRLRVVGNLPYNISTPLLFHLLERIDCIRDMHFMLQREVVLRMAAEPGCKAYGRLSVMLQSRCRVTPLFDVPPAAFYPAPRVDSAFVRITPLADPPVIRDPARFARLVASAFNQRRKTLRNSLAKLIGSGVFEQAGVDPSLRADALPVAGFVRLANASCNSAD